MLMYDAPCRVHNVVLNRVISHAVLLSNQDAMHAEKHCCGNSAAAKMHPPDIAT
jgi:hypothetical protein